MREKALSSPRCAFRSTPGSGCVSDKVHEYSPVNRNRIGIADEDRLAKRKPYGLTSRLNKLVPVISGGGSIPSNSRAVGTRSDSSPRLFKPNSRVVRTSGTGFVVWAVWG